MTKLFIRAIAICLLCGGGALAAPRTLDIYFIDVEGGAATLIVTPTGQSLLIDTGFPGDRDAARIAHVALEVAGLKQIDHCVITHWHRDHVGGVGPLLKLIPIRNFYDHGLPPTIAEDMQVENIDVYKLATQGKSVTLKPGDQIKLQRSPKFLPPLDVRVLAAGGVVLGEQSSAPQVRPCGEDFQSKPEDTSDNANSIGILLAFGRFKFFDGGDLTWNVENRLACPKTIVGPVDVYQVDHHGVDSSNNPVLVRALDPRVAVIDNGPRKGAEAMTFATLSKVAGLQAVYQLHRNLRTPDRDNTMLAYIANEEEQCQGDFILLSVEPDGKSYKVSIPAKHFSRRFQTR
ncbi:MAG TPA: MBL fold metallo-hydrolase [Candidatus Binatia bacterium]|nr:MBL fold metallo-hydrolase [Candidatus Binatia bacterium]